MDGGEDAMMEAGDEEDEVGHIGFAEQVEAARNGWLQGRYYSDAHMYSSIYRASQVTQR